MGISEEMSRLQLEGILEKWLKAAKKDPHSFIARVQIANIFVSGFGWHLVTQAGSEKDLQEVEKAIV